MASANGMSTASILSSSSKQVYFSDLICWDLYTCDLVLICWDLHKVMIFSYFLVYWGVNAGGVERKKGEPIAGTEIQ